ncbi:MAG TPA: hypothetical protein VMP01_01250 [Pirellulaceae bacterium]|nr:hypothetical protein [Pirellulaceae bacterium]
MSQRTGSVVIFSDRERAEHYRSTIEKMVAAGFDRSESEREANMRPLVKAGPLIIRLNETTGEYIVYDEGATIAVKMTDGDQTLVSYFGLEDRVSLGLSYKRGTAELRDVAFTTFGEGGHSAGPIKHTYIDVDGDGRFDRLTDYEAGKLYEQKELQWVFLINVPKNQ